MTFVWVPLISLISTLSELSTRDFATNSISSRMDEAGEEDIKRNSLLI
jgi:hypothetical protein